MPRRWPGPWHGVYMTWRSTVSSSPLASSRPRAGRPSQRSRSRSTRRTTYRRRRDTPRRRSADNRQSESSGTGAAPRSRRARPCPRGRTCRRTARPHHRGDRKQWDTRSSTSRRCCWATERDRPSRYPSCCGRSRRKIAHTCRRAGRTPRCRRTPNYYTSSHSTAAPRRVGHCPFCPCRRGRTHYTSRLPRR